MFNYPINITIDTNAFDATRYNMTKDSTLFVLAGLVEEGKVKVYLSNIVLREVRAHLTEKAKRLYSLIRNNRAELLRNADEDTMNLAGLKEYLVIPDSNHIIKSVCNNFDKYIESLNPVILDNSSIDLEGIIDDYFAYNAPFENSEKKRKEFPDAFIANQIRKGFPEKNSIIISGDKGLKNACLKGKEYRFLDSLGKLFNLISEQDKNYQLTISVLNELEGVIDEEIKNNIERNEDITVFGLEYDRKGMAYGYDYSETFLRSIQYLSHKLFTVDDISENEAIIVLSCYADIEMDCYFEDYDNAPWDSDSKEYVYVDTIHIIEEHKARFAVRLNLDIFNKEFELNNVVVELGGSTRKNRYVFLGEN